MLSTDQSDVIQVLQNLSGFWGRDAQVMRCGEIDDIGFDLAKDDFLEELLPFKDHPDWQGIPEGIKKIILSYGWLIYQQKTIQVETKIITPTCIDIIDRHIPGISTPEFQRAISETLTDEAYHTLLAVKTCQLVVDKRGIDDTYFTIFNLIKQVNNFISDQGTDWQRRLSRVAIACCSECLITDYLSTLSGSKAIQPLFSKAVEAHANDEWVHANIFSTVAASLYPRLDEKSASLFRRAIKHTSSWFFDAEVDVWRTALETVNSDILSNIIRDLPAISRSDGTGETLPRGAQELCETLGISTDDPDLRCGPIN